MEQGPDNPEIYKLMGSLTGAFISLVYIKPVNIRDAISRAIFSTICGLVFGFYLREKMTWDETPEKIFAASTFVAAVSWAIAGAVILGIKSWAEKQKS